MIPTNANFTAVADDSGIKPVVLVEFSGNGAWMFTSRTLVAGMGTGYDDYRNLIQNVSAIEHRLPAGQSGVAIISDVKIKLLNTNPILSNTINKEITATTISFTDAGGSPDYISDSGNGFEAAGFQVGDSITVTGSTSNDGTYTINSMNAGTLTLDPGNALTTEAAGDTVTIRTDYNLENKTVTVKAGFMQKTDGTDFLLADFITIFTGIVKDYGYDEQFLSVTIQDPTFKRHRTIPQTPITNAAAHEKNKGELYPITYGILDYARGYLDVDTLGSQRVKWDTQEIGVVNNLYIYDEDTGMFAQVSDTEEDGTGSPEYVVTESSAIATFNAATNPFAEKGLLFFRFIYLLNETIQPGQGTYDGHDDVQNPDNVWDGNTGTYTRFWGHHTVFYSDIVPKNAIFNFNNFGETDARYKINVTSPHIGDVSRVALLLKYSEHPLHNQEANPYDCFFFFQIQPREPSTDLFVVGGYDEYRSELYIPDTAYYNNIDGGGDVLHADVTSMVIGSKRASSGRNNADSLTRWDRSGWETLKDSRLVMGIYQASDSALAEWYTDVYLVKVLVISNIKFDKAPRIYADMEGRIFGGTWNGRKTAAGTVTYPYDIIEGIYRHELGLTDSDIDDTNFDAVETLLGTDLAFAGQVLETIDSKDVVNKICKEATLRQFKRYDGTESLSALDILGATSDADFDSDTILKGSFKVAPENMKYVYNEYFVFWNKNQETGEYDNVTYLDASGSNFPVATMSAESAAAAQKCNESQTKYGMVNRFSIKADWIRDETTAAKLIYRLCYTLKSYERHHIATFKTQLYQGFPLELCDTITIDYDWLPTELNGTSHMWEVIGTKTDPLAGTVEIKAKSFEGI